MTDDEYISFLEAVAKEHISLHRALEIGGKEGSHYLLRQFENMEANARLAYLVEERSGTQSLYRALADSISSYNAKVAKNVLSDAGILEALDQHAEIVFGNLTRVAIPDQDLEILRMSGMKNPEAVLRIAITGVRRQWSDQRIRDQKRPTEVYTEAISLIEDASRDLMKADSYYRECEAIRETTEDYKKRNEKIEKLQKPKEKPKKWFGGLARIAAGLASSVGNVLLGIGVIPTGVGAPVGVAGVLASCAAATVLIGDGIDSLR